jgi:hypothetical protein
MSKSGKSTSAIWLPDEEMYLQSIKTSCEHLSKLYLEKYRKCKSLQTKLKLPAIIVGSFTGVASFGTDAFPLPGQKYVAIGVGIVSICIAILNTIESYLKVGENTNSAISAATQLQQLREDINRELCLPSNDRVDSGIVFLRDVYTRYIQILNQAPILENQENMAYTETIKKVPTLISNRTTEAIPPPPSPSLPQSPLPPMKIEPAALSQVVINVQQEPYRTTSLPVHRV